MVVVQSKMLPVFLKEEIEIVWDLNQRDACAKHDSAETFCHCFCFDFAEFNKLSFVN